MGPDPSLEYQTKDPAPAAPETTPTALEARLTRYDGPLFDRFQALFALRNLGGRAAVDVLGRALLNDPSPLLRHEVAYVFGQMGHPDSFPYLEKAILEDAHPMVRHEAVEALGNLPQVDAGGLLRRVLRDDADNEVRDSAELALANLEYLRDGDAF